jgi:quercetin dioxygenase-like cupin family protein
MDPVMHDLTLLTTWLMNEAAVEPSGRVVKPLDAFGERVRVVGIGLDAGSELPEHDNPGDATLQVLAGSVTLFAEGHEFPLAAGRLMPVPQARHRVEAHETSALLLTQVPRG